MSNQRFPVYLFALCVLILGFGMHSPALPSGDSINLKYDGQALSDVMKRVSEASGFTIVVNGHGRDAIVSGKIENLPLEEAVRMILRRFSSTVVWDEKNRKIMISVYDSSLEKGTGIRTPIVGGVREPIQSYPYTSQPSSGRKADPYQNGDRGARISGEGRRFVQGTRTTGP